MASLRPSTQLLLSLVLLVVVFPRFSLAFGAGNIGSTSSIEGINWRHGDLEDTLLTLLISRAAGGKKFSKMDVKRVYFGNWLRDYSQAVDVGSVSKISAEAIRIVLSVLSFLSFGYATGEFELTSERLGCYRPEEHIDNPRDYADNQDARKYDPRLRGPIDEAVELAVDPRTALKNYIANEQVGITTSAGLIRHLFGRSIELGRSFARTKNNDELYEALRLLGTGCHCLEDYGAHSNYTELALIELGERDVFPHVGRDCLLQVDGARNRIYPITTGTFGSTDFIHSVLGEVNDKSTQSEITQLEGAMVDSEGKGNASFLKAALDLLPSGLLGGDQKGKADELEANSAAAKIQNMNITPKEPEEFTRQLEDIQRQIYPILEFHDELMKSINAAIEKIPVLPELLDRVSEALNVFVFSLLAPFVVPLIRQIESELKTGSSQIIKSSKEKQLNTFDDDREDNPTHSMLSKDHFSNVLNEPAGKVASEVLKWVVPQLIEAWDDDRIDVNRLLDRVVSGVFHHPALRDRGDDGARDCRNAMFRTVEQWWGNKNDRERQELRDQLGRDGVKNGRNHTEGVKDCGHGSGVPLRIGGGQQPGSGGVLGGITGTYGTSSNSAIDHVSQMASEAAGGGSLGGMVGGLVSGVGSSLLGGVFGKKEERTHESHSNYQSSQSDYQSSAQSGRQDTYGQSSGSYSQGENYGGSSGYGNTSASQYSQESRPSYGGNSRYENRNDDNEYRQFSNEGRHHARQNDESSYGDYSSENRIRNDYGGSEQQSYGSRNDRSDYSGGNRRDGEQYSSSHGRRQEYGGRVESYGNGREEHGGGREESYGGGRNEYSSGRQEYGGGREESYGGGRGESYGGGREESYGGGREENYGGRREESYGGREESYGGGREEYGSGRQEYGGGREESYGGGRGEYEGDDSYSSRRNEYNEGEEEGYGRRNDY